METKMVKKESVKLAGFTLKTKTKDGINFKAILKFWQKFMNDGRIENLHGESFPKNYADYRACFPQNPERRL